MKAFVASVVFALVACALMIGFATGWGTASAEEREQQEVATYLGDLPDTRCGLYRVYDKWTISVTLITVCHGAATVHSTRIQ